MTEPLLFIQTPPSYYIDLDEKQVSDDTLYEESTSIYEISRKERIKNPVIARQLHYFSQPINRKNRYLVFHMENGEKHTGIIEELIGVELKIKSDEEFITINANHIQSISLSNKPF